MPYFQLIIDCSSIIVYTPNIVKYVDIHWLMVMAQYWRNYLVNVNTCFQKVIKTTLFLMKILFIFLRTYVNLKSNKRYLYLTNLQNIDVKYFLKFLYICTNIVVLDQLKIQWKQFIFKCLVQTIGDTGVTHESGENVI